MKIVLTENFCRLLKDLNLNNQQLGTIFSSLINMSTDQNSGLVEKKLEGLKDTFEFRVNEQYRIIFGKDKDFLFPNYIWDKQNNPKKEAKISERPSFIPKIKMYGITNEHFKLLETSALISNMIDENDYHDRINFVFHDILINICECINREILKLGMNLHYHISHTNHINKGPIVWAVFTNNDDPAYTTYPQIGFHIGAGNCTQATFSTGNIDRHISIKVVEFGTRPGYRRFVENLYNDNNGTMIHYFHKRCRSLRGKYFLYFRKSKLESEIYNLDNLTNENDVLNFLGETEEIAKREGFFALEISRQYEGEDLKIFEDFDLAISEIVSNLVEIIPIYFLFTENDPENRWKRYEPHLNKFRDSKIYKKSTFIK